MPDMLLPFFMFVLGWLGGLLASSRLLTPMWRVQERVERPTDWLIWSFEHRGWWKANHQGYTENYSEAGIYSRAEAEEIVRRANKYCEPGKPNEAMLPVDVI